MNVENPGQIDEGALNDATLERQLMNAAVGEFQRSYSRLAKTGGILSDELVTGHNFATIEAIDLRQLAPDNGTMSARVYTPLQRARFAANDATERLQGVLDNPDASLSIARAQAYGGYSHVFLGEYFCEAPIDGGPMQSSDEILELAVERFDNAIRIAEASGESAASVDTVVNLARVGAARASLQMQRNDDAIAFAAEVPEDFEAWVFHSSNPASAFENNRYFGSITGSNHNIGVAETFRDLDDPRVRHYDEPRTGHNGRTLLWTPFQAPSFEGWTPDEPRDFERSTNMRFSSGLEARYIIAEASGPSAETLALVNERRTVGEQDAVDLSGDDLMAELREQRRRDFYLDGHRVGDLRRYAATGQGNFWPSGPHPNDEWGDFGDDECFIVPQNELDGNPNL